MSKFMLLRMELAALGVSLELDGASGPAEQPGSEASLLSGVAGSILTLPLLLLLRHLYICPKHAMQARQKGQHVQAGWCALVRLVQHSGGACT